MLIAHMSSPVGPPTTWRQRLVFAGRLLVIALLIGICWSTAHSLYRLFRPAPMIAAPANDAIPLPIESINTLPPEGYWTFSDFDWRFSQHDVAVADVPTYLQQLARSDAPIEPKPSAQELDILKSLAVQGVERKPLTPDTLHYRWPGPLTMHALVRERAGERRLLAAVLELPSGDQRKLLHLSPQAASAEVKESPQHLLPLPAETARVVARWSNDDELQLECVSTPHPLTEILRLAEEGGWKVRSFIAAPDEIGTYLCEREAELILVYELPADTTKLMLVRTPGLTPR
jgi:hypothetical protein